MEHRILYIEDNAVNVELVSQIIMTVYGLEVASASSAADGISAVQEEVPTLILLDINLPDMSGLEAIKQIRKTDGLADIPIVGLSANAMPADIQRAKDAGFNDYLTKPLDLPVVIGVLNTYLT